MTQKEANQIDANDIEYYTLTDGTIIHIKGEDKNDNKNDPELQSEDQLIPQKKQNKDINIQSQNQLLEENNKDQTSIEQTNQISHQEQEQNQNIISNQYQYQEESQMRVRKKQILNYNQNHNNFQKNNDLTSGIQIQSREEEILEPGKNYGYFTSNKIKKNTNNYKTKLFKKNKVCGCNHILAEGYINVNAQLINAEVSQDPILEQLELKDLVDSGPQSYSEGPLVKRQFYKLIEAVPIEFEDIYGNLLLNQKNKNNMVLNLQQYNYNTYIVEKSRSKKQNINQAKEQNYKARTYQNIYRHNYNYNYSPVNRHLNNQKNMQQNQQYIHYDNDRYYNNHQIKTVKQSKKFMG